MPLLNKHYRSNKCFYSSRHPHSNKCPYFNKDPYSNKHPYFNKTPIPISAPIPVSAPTPTSAPIPISLPVSISAPIPISFSILFQPYKTARAREHWDWLLKFIFLNFLLIPNYENRGQHLSLSTLMSAWVHSSFKRIIWSQNFVMIAALIFLARKVQGCQVCTFPSLLGPFPRNIKTLFQILLFIKKEMSPVPISSLVQIDTLPWGTKGK